MRTAIRLVSHLSVSTALCVLVAPLSASADVPRNQIQTLRYTVTVQGGYVHSYTVNPNPCGPDFTGTGQYPPAPASPTFNESFSGTVGGQPAPGVSLSYTDVYYDPTSGNPTGYTYTFNGAFTDTQGDFTGGITDNGGNTNLPTSGQITGATSTNFKSHGDYVNSLPSSQRAAAANSCVGMPQQSRK
jgi:hypothetical protein